MTDLAREALSVVPPPAGESTSMEIAVAALRRLVERSASGAGGLSPSASARETYRREIDGLLRGGRWTALARLGAVLGLSTFERDLLLLTAAVQVDPTLLAAAGKPADVRPTLGLAFALLGENAWGALSPGSPLQRYHLLVADPTDLYLLAPLRIDESVLAFLLGASASDGRAVDLVEWVHPVAFLSPTHTRVADRMAAFWRDGVQAPGAPSVIQVAGGDDVAAPRSIAALACSKLNVRLGAIRSADVPGGANERASAARLWEREHAMSGAVLLIDLTDDTAETWRAAVELAEVVGAPVVLATRAPISLRRRDTVRLEAPRPLISEQVEIWRHALPPSVQCPEEALEGVASQFRSSTTAVEEVAASLRGSLEVGAAPGEVGRALQRACRVASRQRLDSLAARISSNVGWDDLVVPEHTARALREISAQLRQRALVYEKWGLAGSGDRGLGISALFHGESGTGKTLAAEVIANELALDLFRVDLSRVVSKYIGETEKNLRRVFDAAEESGAILLFDEADALFGKRSDVKDSHDRYANIEVSYLLSRMETYRGLAILTTNFRQSLDQAFTRRLRFVVHFAFPDASQRAAIWARAFPPQAPVRGLDPAALSRLAVTGGSIRNIAMAAAFLAADAGQPITGAHVVQAAATEYGKLNKTLMESETRGLV
ncbi:MAG TPA: AAA family ATPase [Polyangia bacterium]|nr:AAA family ATPase [Polyangia bacterium]